MTESILIIGGYGVAGHRIAADLAPEFPGAAQRGRCQRGAYPRTMGACTVITRLSVDPPPMSRLPVLLAATHANGIAARPRIRAAFSRLRQARASETCAPYALRVDVTHDGRTATAWPWPDCTSAPPPAHTTRNNPAGKPPNGRT